MNWQNVATSNCEWMWWPGYGLILWVKRQNTNFTGKAEKCNWKNRVTSSQRSCRAVFDAWFVDGLGTRPLSGRLIIGTRVIRFVVVPASCDVGVSRVAWYFGVESCFGSDHEILNFLDDLFERRPFFRVVWPACQPQVVDPLCTVDRFPQSISLVQVLFELAVIHSRVGNGTSATN